MREIKFRQAIFKDGKFHHWHYWGFCGYRGAFVSPIRISPMGDSVEPTGYEVKDSQQYTGLRCGPVSMGKGIYEGDKVKRPNGETGIVEYRDACFTLQRMGDWHDWEYIQQPSEYFIDCEIIGIPTY